MHNGPTQSWPLLMRPFAGRSDVQNARGAESGYLLSKSVKIIIYAVQDNRTWS